MLSEETEFLIAQRAEELAAEARGASLGSVAEKVAAVLARDPATRPVLDAYMRLENELHRLAEQQPVPEVRWDKLEAAISRQIRDASADDGALDDRVQQQLSRLAANELESHELAEVDRLLASDPQARLLLAEYATIDRGLAAVRDQPLPDVRWDALSAHLSRTIEASAFAGSSTSEGAPAKAAEPEAEVVAGRIGFDDGRSAGVNRRRTFGGAVAQWFVNPVKLAMAASVLIVGGLSLRLALRDSGAVPATGGPAATPAPSIVAAPVVPPPGASFIVVNPSPVPLPPGSVVANVQIGPPAGSDVDRARLAEELRQDALTRPSRVVVSRERSEKSKDDTAAAFPGR